MSHKKMLNELVMTPRNYGDIEVNKHFNLSNTTKFNQLKDSVIIHLALNSYHPHSHRALKSTIQLQLECESSEITIKTSWFQQREDILYMLQDLLSEERQELFRLAIQSLFNCDLSNRKIVIKHDYSVLTYE